MKSTKLLFAVGLMGLAVFSGCMHQQKGEKNPPVNNKAVMDDSKAKENKVINDQISAKYEDYNAKTFAAHTGKKALFFHADWCSTCRAMDKDILENLTKFPAGTYIAKADYDTETALKAEYGVTTQSTVVFFDENGKMVETKLAPSYQEIASFFAM